MGDHKIEIGHVVRDVVSGMKAPETRIEYVRDSEGKPVKVALPG